MKSLVNAAVVFAIVAVSATAFAQQTGTPADATHSVESLERMFDELEAESQTMETILTAGTLSPGLERGTVSPRRDRRESGPSLRGGSTRTGGFGEMSALGEVSFDVPPTRSRYSLQLRQSEAALEIFAVDRVHR